MECNPIICGLALSIFAGCANPKNATPPEENESATQDRVDRTLPPPKAKRVDIPFPYELHPDIIKITLSSGQRCLLDHQELESMQKILNELENRRRQIEKAGIFCQISDKRSDEINWDAYGELSQYCNDNNIDLFCSLPLGLPSFENLVNIHWILQSTKTQYVIPEPNR